MIERNISNYKIYRKKQEMPDYSKSKIYKLESPSGLVYVGSTTQPLCERKAGHMKDYKKWKLGKLHNITSFKLFEEDNGNVEIYLIENYPCHSKEELHAREGHWIKNTNCVNRLIMGRTKREYYQDNKEYFSELCKKYYEEHKEHLDKYRKEWREDNKETEREKKKVYREQNAEIIKAHKNLRCDCDCGTSYTQANKGQHIRSKKHQQFINNLE
jgi:hypothetical protein